MKKSMNLLKRSRSSKIRDIYKHCFPYGFFLPIGQKQLLQAAAAILFTALLSAFGMPAGQPLQTVSDCSATDQAALHSVAVQQEVSEGSLLTAPSAPAGTESFSDFDAADGIEMIADAPEYAAPDLDDLLSVVRSLPGGDELSCSRPALLLSSAAKKVLDILEDFQETGHHVGFILLDLSTGDFFSFHPDHSFYSASTMKGPYVAALNKFSPESVDDDTKSLMEHTIVWSSNEDYEMLHYLYGNDVMFDMTAYTAVSDSIIDDYNWYPYLTAKELTQLWIGTYFYFFEDTNEQSRWCRSLFTDTAQSFIGSALDGEHTVYTKAGWYTDWEDTARNDAGIVRADGRDYILTIMSDSFDSYDELEALAAALNELQELLYSPGTEAIEAAAGIA